MFTHLMGTGALQNASTAVTDTCNTPRSPDIEFIQPQDGVGPGAPAEDGNNCGFFGSCSEGGGFGN